MCAAFLRFIAQKLSLPNPYHALVIAMPAGKAARARKAAPKAEPRAVRKKPAAAKQRTKAKHTCTTDFKAGLSYKHA